MIAHAYDFQLETKDAALAKQLAEDYRKAPFDAATRALLDYAWKLTLTPADMSQADVDALRKAGFDDRGVSDAAQVIAYFNYINRIADGLGVDPEAGLTS